MIKPISFYNIRIDWEKSHDSFIYDKNTGREYLDFFGQYSTIPLGYNHPIFNEEFYEEIKRVAHTKIVNCEIHSDEYDEFHESFKKYAGKDYNNFFYCNGGGVAVENAMKVALDNKKSRNAIFIGLKNSFHGITGLSGAITDRFPPINKHFPLGMENMSRILRIVPEDKALVDFILDQQYKDQIAAIVVEPIQCTAGDIHISKGYLKYLYNAAKNKDIPIIFDCVQVGFGGTGSIWYYQQLGIKPDIVVFGKKTQVSGIMTNMPIDESKLSVTWDGDIIDMIRCKYIIKAYKKYNILDNVKKRAKQLAKGLSEIDKLNNLRHAGLLFAFDLPTKAERDILWKSMYDNGMLFLKTRWNTIRLRPPLSVSEDEVNQAIEIISRSI